MSTKPESLPLYKLTPQFREAMDRWDDSDELKAEIEGIDGQSERELLNAVSNLVETHQSIIRELLKRVEELEKRQGSHEP